MIHYANNKDKYMSYVRSEYGKFKLYKIHTNLEPIPGVNKPASAFWGSPVFSNENWAEALQYLELDIEYSDVVYWHLSKGSKVLQVTLKDTENGSLDEFIVQDDDLLFRKCPSYIDYQKLKDRGFVALELMDGGIGHYFKNKTELMFNAFDCDSIVVLDPKKIVVDFVLNSEEKYFNELEMTEETYNILKKSVEHRMRILRDRPTLIADLSKLDTYELSKKYDVSRTQVSVWRKMFHEQLGMPDDQLYPKIRKYKTREIIPVDELLTHKPMELSRKYGQPVSSIKARKYKLKKNMNMMKNLGTA